MRSRLRRFGEGPFAYVLGVQETRSLKTTLQTKWAGMDISWVDSKLLGWHLGIEPLRRSSTLDTAAAV